MDESELKTTKKRKLDETKKTAKAKSTSLSKPLSLDKVSDEKLLKDEEEVKDFVACYLHHWDSKPNNPSLKHPKPRKSRLDAYQRSIQSYKGKNVDGNYSDDFMKNLTKEIMLITDFSNDSSKNREIRAKFCGSKRLITASQLEADLETFKAYKRAIECYLKNTKKQDFNSIPLIINKRQLVSFLDAIIAIITKKLDVMEKLIEIDTRRLEYAKDLSKLEPTALLKQLTEDSAYLAKFKDSNDFLTLNNNEQFNFGLLVQQITLLIDQTEKLQIATTKKM